LVYLHQLLSRLSDEEIAQIKLGSSLSGKEAEVFDYLADKRKTDCPGIEEMAGELEMSSSHFRKNLSGIMPKVFIGLGLERPIDKFGFLCHRMLHEVLRHEVNMQTKRWEKEGETEELRQLYSYVIEMFMNMDLSGYDEKYIDSLSAKYRALYPEKTDDPIILPQIQKALFEIDTLPIRPKFKGKFKQHKEAEFKSVVNRCKQVIHSGTEDEALLYWSFYFLGMYYSKMELDFGQAIDSLQQLEAITKGKSSHEALRFSKRSLMVLAMVYLRESRFEESYQSFKLLFERDPDLYKKGLYYSDHFMRLCISMNKLQEAEEVLMRAFELDLENPDYSNSDEYAVLALIEMMTDRMDDAFTHIQWAKQGLQKNYFFHLDSMTRLIEQGYFVLNGDWELAVDTGEKNTKFFDYHKEKEESALFKNVPGLLTAMID
jgi:tetratricopeptide (TPR) repeat protein